MKWLNDYGMRLMLVGFVAAIVIDGGNAKGDFTFGEVTNLSPTVIDRSGQNRGASLSADGLTLFFSSVLWKDTWDYDLYMVARETLDDDWDPAVSLGPTVNSVKYDEEPSISTDGLELYFSSMRSGGSGDYDIWITQRPTKDDPWQEPVNLGLAVNTTAAERDPSISGNGLELYFSSKRSGGSGDYDIWITQRPTKDDPWQEPVNLGPVINSSSADYAPDITADGLTIIFSSKRLGKYSSYADLWATTRRTTADPWREPFNLGPVINVINTDDMDWADISPDGTTLFLSCFNRPGGSGLYNLWQTPIIPIVDLNGDGIVDATDMCIMVDDWHTESTLCDIAPLPFGDGYVDVQDLLVLAEHLLPVFPAHWELDETEGGIAYDSAGDHDGTLNGNPLWQPVGGKVNGALQLDGVDDYVSTPFILNTINGALSAFTWIKGGGPGQVIVSQTNGTGWGGSWLCADSLNGRLATVLMDPQPTLVSESVITDGAWHHIGLVWDKSYRYLYVDGAEVARDVVSISYPMPCDGGLYLGAGKNLDTGSFYSGLIDDVRIYRRALTAEEIAALAQ